MPLKQRKKVCMFMKVISTEPFLSVKKGQFMKTVLQQWRILFMKEPHNTFGSLKSLGTKKYYSIQELEKQGFGNIKRLPVSVRVVLESLLRNLDGLRVTEEDVRTLANWKPTGNPDGDVPFIVSRVLLQDFTGVPLLVDLAAMRDSIAERGGNPSSLEPLVPVDLVVDHSVQVDKSSTEDSYIFNLKTEFERNKERYSFLKWGQQAFKTLRVVPPGIGICHQVNLEYFGTVLSEKDNILFPDTLVGTDSHTTMINGLGVVGWGVGGIEAEAAMLNQPVSLQMPDVIGVHMSGALKEGVTATDLTLRVTELLRKENVVGKFVEFFGEGAASLTVADRATIGNMSPEYGATMGYFPVDEKTLDYMRLTGRNEKHIKLVEEYYKAQGLFGIPRKGQVDYTKVLELDLSTILPCVSGPKRPQDRIELTKVKSKFKELLILPVDKGGYGKNSDDLSKKFTVKLNGFDPNGPHITGGIETLNKSETWSETEMVTNRPITPETDGTPGYADEHIFEDSLGHGSVVIAAITSCTNTSNPSVMIAAGLVAKKAVEKGLEISPKVKTSLAPGSRVVTDYLDKSGLQPYLDKLGFELVAYGCTTCIGNSGPLDDHIESTIKNNDIITASVLSGNRNFEARIHGSVKANFLMSPPLVVAYALAGNVNIDLTTEPLGKDKDGKPVFLKDLWPTDQEIQSTIKKTLDSSMFTKRYSNIMEDNPVWKEIHGKTGANYAWDADSTYIQKPPYLDDFSDELPKIKEFKDMRPLALFGDSVTTDHISPAGAFKSGTPAGKFLIAHGVDEKHFNSYGSRRGNHLIMMRGTFANVRIRNHMADGKEGGYTKVMPEGTLTTIFEASEAYAKKNVPLIIFAGKDYGMGSSRDWAAKGPALLGVRVVVATSFERIHRSNLIGMGILPLEFQDGKSWESIGIKGTETFSLLGLEKGLAPRQKVILEVNRDGKKEQVNLISRLDTPIEVQYYLNGGIMPFMLRQLKD